MLLGQRKRIKREIGRLGFKVSRLTSPLYTCALTKNWGVPPEPERTPITIVLLPSTRTPEAVQPIAHQQRCRVSK